MASHTHHISQTICNALWGHQLRFHPYQFGDPLVDFSSLWPEKRSLVETYVQADLAKSPYELAKLLLATNSATALNSLLEDKLILVNHCFSPGNVTLCHLACVLGLTDIVNVLIKRSLNMTTIWGNKDDEEHTPHDVCFNKDVRRLLPKHTMSIISFRKTVPSNLVLKMADRDRIFEMAANPDSFYGFILHMQMFNMSVNTERNAAGDLLVHVAVKGGLQLLPLLFVLIHHFRADVTVRNSEGLTPLCLAAKLGESKIAEILVCVFGANINEYDETRYWTALHYAVQFNHPEVVSMLLTRGADTQSEDKNKCVPAFLALKCKAIECRHIIRHYIRDRTEELGRRAADGTLVVGKLYPSDAFLVTSAGFTLLMMAAMSNRTELLSHLVTMEKCPFDFRQMKASCDLFDSLSVSMSVRQSPAHSSSQSLKTAAHFTAERGHVECLQILLDAGAHPSIADANAMYPLHYACDNEHVECVKAIVTSSHLGLSGLNPAIDIAKGNAEIMELLTKAKERRQAELVTPMLFEAAASGNRDYLIAVLENGDNVNPTNEAHDWPILLAAGYGHYEFVKQLHEFGGHVTRHHRRSRSNPLHVAARGGHSKVVEYLLKFCLDQAGSPPPSPLPAGANGTASDAETTAFLDVNQRNAAGCTPLELASSQGHTEVVRMLLDHGASSTLPDSNGRLISCAAFAGTQFRLESHRNQRKRTIIHALTHRTSAKEFSKIWRKPSDFNLHSEAGDSMLMVAAHYASRDVLNVLIQSATSCRPGMLISPGQPLPLTWSSLVNSSSSEHELSSDNSLPARAGLTPPTEARRPRADSTDSDHFRPATALPAIFQRSTPKTAAGKMDRPNRRGPQKHSGMPKYYTPMPRPPPNPTANKKRSSGVSTATSSEEDVLKRSPVANGNRCETIAESPPNGTNFPRGLKIQPPPKTTGGGRGAGSGATRTSGSGGNDEENHTDSDPPSGNTEFTRITRYVNPNDGQSALHRAATACRHDNLMVLITADPGCANIRDVEGNTALHVACLKSHRLCIQTLLKFNSVDSSLRNEKGKLAEDLTVKSSLKKIVAKHRIASFPSPPGNEVPHGMASVGPVDPNGAAGTTTPELLIPEFEARMEMLKQEWNAKHTSGGSS